jgi:hypothetical protein
MPWRSSSAIAAVGHCNVLEGANMRKGAAVPALDNAFCQADLGMEKRASSKKQDAQTRS